MFLFGYLIGFLSSIIGILIFSWLQKRKLEKQLKKSFKARFPFSGGDSK